MSAVFLSHSSKDKEFVRELCRRLKRDGVDCFFDAESIGWGDNRVRALERALDECTYIVFVLSPDFCNSEWAEVERTSSLADDPAGLKRKVRPLMLRDCGALKTFPRFLWQAQTLDVSTQTSFEANYPKLSRDLGGVVVPDIETSDRTKLPPVQPLPEHHRMPYHSLADNFVGRVDDLWRIYDALHRDSTAILPGVGIVAGTGGLGKSQAAIEYAHRFGAGYRGGVYWVEADRGLGPLISQVSEAAGIAIDTNAEEPDQLQQLWVGLDRMAPSLVVLDNFPEKIPLRPYLPIAGRVHTLVTTRRKDVAAYPYVLLDTLSLQAGIQLLNSGVRQFATTDAAALVERLGGLPLALELAKSFLNYRTDIGVKQVVPEMQTAGEMGVLRDFAAEYRDELPSRHEMDVALTFQISWELAPATGKSILRAMADLAPFPVPRALLRRILGWGEPAGLKDELGKSLSELSRLSLLELDSNSNPAMHRLIHAFVRYRNGVDQVSLFERSAQVVLEEMGRTFGDPASIALRELDLLVSHGEALLSGNRLTADDSVSLMGSVAKHHRTLGRYTIARRFATNALETAKKTFEPGHPAIARSQSNLAGVLQDLGQLVEARDVLRNALVLQDQGQRAEACDLLRNALAFDEKTFEPGHPAIARSQSNLAVVLQDQEQPEEARDLLRNALASDEKTFEPGHPAIARRQSNLATVLQDQGQLAEARDLLSEALASTEKTFEPGHPAIARRQSNLALVLRDQGQLAEAHALLSKALASTEKTFEPGHPAIAKMQSNLALVLRDQGQLAEAHALQTGDQDKTGLDPTAIPVPRRRLLS